MYGVNWYWKIIKMRNSCSGRTFSIRRMFKCRMLTMKLQIDYLIFSRSMREDKFKLFRWLGAYLYIFKMCFWLSLPITHPKHYQELEGGTFLVQISGSNFLQTCYDQPNSKTIKCLKRPINFVNCARDALQSRLEIGWPKIAKYLKQSESKILRRWVEISRWWVRTCIWRVKFQILSLALNIIKVILI